MKSLFTSLALVAAMLSLPACEDKSGGTSGVTGTRSAEAGTSTGPGGTSTAPGGQGAGPATSPQPPPPR